MVTLVEPEDSNIGDPIGAERMFTAECDQPATIRVTWTATWYTRALPVFKRCSTSSRALPSSPDRCGRRRTSSSVTGGCRRSS